MAQKVPTATPFLPALHTLASARDAVTRCQGCDLHAHATQAVFGEGPPDARVMLVGEQPGNDEDLAGHPFVGPAGRLLDEALAAAGIARGEVFVTNAVKHFKFHLRGKRRLHDKPTRYETKACTPWLDLELELVKPEVLVLLGATAAQALLGTTFKVSEERGKPFTSRFAPRTLATVHPASVLRAPDAEQVRAARAAFFADLAVVKTLM